MLQAPTHNRTALLFYALTLAAVPLCAPLMKLTGGVENPFLFSAMVRAGMAGSTVAFTTLILGPWAWEHRRHLLPTTLPLVRSWPGLMLTISLMDTVLLGYSAQLVDLSTAIVVQELHPIATILTSLWLYRRTGSYRASPTRLILLLPACCISLALLTGAEAGSIAQGLGLEGQQAPRIAAGLGLSALIMTMVSTTAIANRHCSTLALQFTKATGDPDPRRTAAFLFCVLFSTACCASTLLSLTGAAAAGEHMTGRQLYLSLVGTGMIFCFLTSATWRTALLLTDNLQMNALLYLNGPSSLAFMWLAGLVDVASPPHLLAGAAVAVTANAAANIRLPRPNSKLTKEDRPCQTPPATR